MLTKTLAATAALSMLVGGGSALAAQPKSATVAGPKQPIPYSQLDAYMKASPKARTSKDWWSGSAGASTGMSADTSATAPAATSDPTSSTMTPSSPTDTSVNPPGMPSTPPTDGAAPNGATMPNPSTTMPSTEPK